MVFDPPHRVVRAWQVAAQASAVETTLLHGLRSEKPELADRLREAIFMPMPKLDLQTILLAVAVAIGLAVLLQTFLLLMILVAVRKTAKVIREETERLHAELSPVLYDTRDFLANTREVLGTAHEVLAETQEYLHRVIPKVETAVGDFAEIAHGLRLQAAEMQSSATELVGQVRRQGDRLDAMISGVLDKVERVGGFVTEAVGKPVRQVSGVLRSVSAIIGSLRSPLPSRQPPGGED
jgi:hypothetical protein